jgi:hypothetical protein
MLGRNVVANHVSNFGCWIFFFFYPGASRYGDALWFPLRWQRKGSLFLSLICVSRSTRASFTAASYFTGNIAVTVMLLITYGVLHRKRLVLHKKNPTFDIGNSWFGTAFSSLHLPIFCQICFSCGPGLTGGSVFSGGNSRDRGVEHETKRTNNGKLLSTSGAWANQPFMCYYQLHLRWAECKTARSYGKPWQIKEPQLELRTYSRRVSHITLLFIEHWAQPLSVYREGYSLQITVSSFPIKSQHEDGWPLR